MIQEYINENYIKFAYWISFLFIMSPILYPIYNNFKPFRVLCDFLIKVSKKSILALWGILYWPLCALIIFGNLLMFLIYIVGTPIIIVGLLLFVFVMVRSVAFVAFFVGVFI